MASVDRPVTTNGISSAYLLAFERAMEHHISSRNQEMVDKMLDNQYLLLLSICQTQMTYTNTEPHQFLEQLVDDLLTATVSSTTEVAIK